MGDTVGDEGPRIRLASELDTDAVLALAREVALDGTTHVSAPPDAPDRELLDYWLSPRAVTFVGELDGQVAGCYLIQPNQAGRGAHVANASYVVASRFRGRGLGRALAEHSLAEARQRGYRAMQFNLVVATNTRAIELWKRLGFEIVGTLPRVFDHPTDGLVDAYVMHREL